VFASTLAGATPARRRSLLSGAAGLAAAVVAPRPAAAELSAAEPEARAAVELATEHHLHFIAPHAHAFLAEALIEQGAHEEARRGLARAELGPMRGTRPEARFLHARAQAQLACGAHEPAIADLRACQEIAQSAGGFPQPQRGRLALNARVGATGKRARGGALTRRDRTRTSKRDRSAPRNRRCAARPCAAQRKGRSNRTTAPGRRRTAVESIAIGAGTRARRPGRSVSPGRPAHRRAGRCVAALIWPQPAEHQRLPVAHAMSL
jgi:hypothetical protein